MNAGTKKALPWIFAAAIILGIAAVVIIQLRHRKPLVLRGAVTVNSSNSRKEVPIADVVVSVSNDIAQGTAKTDASSFIASKPAAMSLSETRTQVTGYGRSEAVDRPSTAKLICPSAIG